MAEKEKTECQVQAEGMDMNKRIMEVEEWES